MIPEEMVEIATRLNLAMCYLAHEENGKLKTKIVLCHFVPRVGENIIQGDVTYEVFQVSHKLDLSFDQPLLVANVLCRVIE